MLIHTSVNILIIIPCDWLIKRKDFLNFYIIKCIYIKDCIFHTCGGKEHRRTCLYNNHVAVWDLLIRSNFKENEWCMVKIQGNYTCFIKHKMLCLLHISCFQWVLNIKVSGMKAFFSWENSDIQHLPMVWWCGATIVEIYCPLQDDCSARAGIGEQAE